MDQIKIGKFIAQLRKEKEWTQEQLGEKLNVSSKSISRWENGNYMPDISLLQLIALEFDVTINEILKGERIEIKEQLKESNKNIIGLLNNKTKMKKRFAMFTIIGLIAILIISTISIIQTIKLKQIKEDYEDNFVFKNDIYVNGKNTKINLNNYHILKSIGLNDKDIDLFTGEDIKNYLDYYYSELQAYSWYSYVGRYETVSEKAIGINENIGLIKLIEKGLPFVNNIKGEKLNELYCFLGYSKYGTLILSEYNNNKCMINLKECSRLKEEGSINKITLNNYCN